MLLHRGTGRNYCGCFRSLAPFPRVGSRCSVACLGHCIEPFRAGVRTPSASIGDFRPQRRLGLNGDPVGGQPCSFDR